MEQYAEVAPYLAAMLRAADGRRPQPAGHAGCQPCEVASGAHHVVLRDVSADGTSAGISGLSIPLSATCSILITTRSVIVRCGVAAYAVASHSGEVHAYRRHVDEAMARLLSRELTPEVQRSGNSGTEPRAAASGTDPDGREVRVGAESAASSVSRVGRCRVETCGSVAPALRWQSFPEGVYSVGSRRRRVRLRQRRSPPQRLPRAVSAGFAAGDQWRVHGVHARRTATPPPTLWLSDGWDCVRANQWSAPLVLGEARTANGGITPWMACGRCDAEEPVCHVSYYEADAFARWAGARLATEFEWEVASRSCAK